MQFKLADSLVNKLSVGCQEIHIRCTDRQMLHVTLTSSSTILPSSLNAKVISLENIEPRELPL